MPFALLIAFPLAAAPVQEQPAPRICWIDRVVADGAGVRVFFGEGAPVRPEETSVHLEIGASIAPENSGHDGCSITAARKGDAIGVEASAHFFAPQIMTKPDVRTQWIAAAPAR
jgi:hypothetical protein